MAKEKKDIISRRSIIKAGVGLGALGLSSKSLLAKEANNKNLPPNVPEWTETLDGNRNVLAPDLKGIEELVMRSVPSVSNWAPYGKGKASEKVLETLTSR